MLKQLSKMGVVFSKVSGAWGIWSTWSGCSTTCGTGLQRRTRNCNNPMPAGGGSYCLLGDGLDISICNIRACIMPKGK